MLLGCIGDDFTGSSDLANTLARQGMKAVQYTGIPDGNAAPDVEAGVIALKSRSIPADDAVRLSLDALDWLKAQGCRQFFFKYCSTFDSTKDGNIGPVADALIEALGADCAIVCPAFPGTGRTIYNGHLFVNDRLLNESGMQNHPLTPMTDPDIRRWLGYQTGNEVGHVPFSDVLAGAAAISAKLDAQVAAGKKLIVVDALADGDLMNIGTACAELPLITGGSGVALGLPANFRARGEIGQGSVPWKGEAGRCVALSGSCSVATRGQIERHRESDPALEVLAGDVISGATAPETVCKWLLEQRGVPLAYSSADPDAVAAVQAAFGRERASEALEGFFAEVARLLVEAGVGRLLVAGGETSGAVVEGLGITAMEIGPEIDPGVPAMRAGEGLVLAMKSGNFGAPDFFAKGAAVLAQGA